MAKSKSIKSTKVKPTSRYRNPFKKKDGSVNKFNLLTALMVFGIVGVLVMKFSFAATNSLYWAYAPWPYTMSNHGNVSLVDSNYGQQRGRELAAYAQHPIYDVFAGGGVYGGGTFDIANTPSGVGLNVCWQIEAEANNVTAKRFNFRYDSTSAGESWSINELRYILNSRGQKQDPNMPNRAAGEFCKGFPYSRGSRVYMVSNFSITSDATSAHAYAIHLRINTY